MSWFGGRPTVARPGHHRIAFGWQPDKVARMQLDDAVRIATPEGVALELNLAGVGSRVMATTVDALVQALIIAVGAALVGAAALSVGPDADMLIFASQLLWFTIVFLGYPTIFERFNGGKTPGKSVLGLRVVTIGDQPVTLATAAIRNLFRLIDLLPAFYLGGLVAILATNLNQRIGDVVAGTLVIRDQPPRSDLRYLAAVQLPADTSWDVSAVSDAEVAAIRRYFERRPVLDEATQARLSAQLALRIKDGVQVGDRPRSDEDFLLRVLAEKLTRSSQR